MIIVYTILVIIGSWIAGKLILGELRKERRDYLVLESKVSQQEPEAKPKSESAPRQPAAVVIEKTVPVTTPVIHDNELWGRIRKLEQLLAEKRSELVKLQNVLEAG